MTNHAISLDKKSWMTLSLMGTSPQDSSGLPPWKEVTLALIERGLDENVMDLNQPINQEEGLVAIWERQAYGLPLAILKKIAKLSSSMGGGNKGGEHTLSVILKRWLGPAGDHMATRPAHLSNWLSVVGYDELRLWDAPGDLPAAGLLRFFMESGRRQWTRAGWLPVIESMRGRGIDWTTYHDVLVNPSNKKLMGALFDSGLNLKELGQHAGQALPLWTAWLNKKDVFYTGLVNAALGENENHQETIQKEVYFTGFIKASQAARAESKSEIAERTALWKHLKSRQDWTSLEDGFGRSALFHAVLLNPGVLRQMLREIELSSPERKEDLKKALCHRDRKGRSVWFYLLPNLSDRTLTDKLQTELMEYIPDVLDASGHGWAFQVMKNLEESLEVWRVPGDKKRSSVYFNEYNRKTGAQVSIMPAWMRARAWIVPESKREESIRQVARELFFNPYHTCSVMEGWPKDSMCLLAVEVWIALVNQRSDLCKTKEKRSWMDTRLEELSNAFPAPSLPFTSAELAQQADVFLSEIKGKDSQMTQWVSALDRLVRLSSLENNLESPEGAPQAVRPRL